MNIPELLTDLSLHFNALIRNAASSMRLTASQAFHLVSIPYDGISMTSLSDRLGLDASTLTRNVQKLEKLGLVKRTRGTYDRRIQKIFLTSSGISTVKSLEEKLAGINQLLVDNMTLDAQEKVLEILEQLVWSMDCLREEK